MVCIEKYYRRTVYVHCREHVFALRCIVSSIAHVSPVRPTSDQHLRQIQVLQLSAVLWCTGSSHFACMRSIGSTSYCNTSLYTHYTVTLNYTHCTLALNWGERSEPLPCDPNVNFVCVYVCMFVCHGPA